MAEFYGLNGITTHISVMAVLPENGYHDGLLYSSHCAHVQNQCSFYVQSGWEQGPFVPLVSNTLTAVISSREPFPVMLVCAAEFFGRFPMSNSIGPVGKEGVMGIEEMSLTQPADKLPICHCLLIFTEFLEVDDHA